MYIVTKLNLSVIFTLLECWLLTGTYSPSMIKYTLVPIERMRPDITLFVSVDHGCCLFLPQSCNLSNIKYPHSSNHTPSRQY